ncbi:hypothetical protein C1646_776919 [Rhizophagus diaphanus]|nr:hypothetical protein C1646_776919 [Rhizophagus diaphanus] [Rhizophagus sp. MUCL 43196]
MYHLPLAGEVIVSVAFFDLTIDLSSLLLDGWTSSNHHSYFSFIVITPERKEYVIKVKDLVSDGASAIQLAKRLISEEFPKILPKFVTYFAESHQSGATLYEEIKKELIVGGGLKSSVKTRWSTTWDCCTSMLIANSKAMNQTLRNLVNNQNFWLNVESLTTILESTKNAVKSIEDKNATIG